MSTITDIYLRNNLDILTDLNQSRPPKHIIKIQQCKHRPMFINKKQIYHYNEYEKQWWVWK